MNRLQYATPSMDFASVPLVVGLVAERNDRVQIERVLQSLESARRAGGPRFSASWFLNGWTVEYEKALTGLNLGELQRSPEQLGLGSAHNRLMADAFSYTATRWYVCLSPAAVVHPDMFSELVARLARMQKPGLLDAAQFPDEHPRAYDPGSGEAPWCSGCALLITRELYESVGGFDENIFNSLEDVDLSWRARVAGFNLATASSALVGYSPVDPAPSQSARADLLRAGAYLAAKWGSEEFQQKCADDFQQLQGAPLAIPRPNPPSPAMRAVADFSAAFHFAPVRW